MVFRDSVRVILFVFSVSIFASTIQASQQRLACYYFDRKDPYQNNQTFKMMSSYLPFVWAKDKSSKDLLFEGNLVNGFFEIEGITQKAARKICEESVQNAFPKAQIQLMHMAVKISSWHRSRYFPAAFSADEEERFNKLVIFGDSLSDQGRIREMVGVVPGKHYFAGRFSNLRIWPDYLQESTGVSIQNFATAGSLSGQITGINFNKIKGLARKITDGAALYLSGTLDDQLEKYRKVLTNNQHEKTLFAIWSGANDYLMYIDHNGIADRFLDNPDCEVGYRTVIKRVTGNIEKAIRTLYERGARHFIIPNLPDLGALPRIIDNKTYRKDEPREKRLVFLSNKLTTVSNDHNGVLRARINALREELAGISITLIDIAREIKDTSFALRHSIDLSFEDSHASIGKKCYRITSSCPFSQGQFEEDDEMFFWDDVHPSTHAHCRISWIIQKGAAENNVFKAVSFEEYLEMYQRNSPTSDAASIEPIITQ